jgi:hypothetical protein
MRIQKSHICVQLKSAINIMSSFSWTAGSEVSEQPFVVHKLSPQFLFKRFPFPGHLLLVRLLLLLMDVLLTPIKGPVSVLPSWPTRQSPER